MADRLAALDELRKPAQGGLGGGSSAKFLLLDSGQSEDGLRHSATGIDELLQGRGDVVGGEGDSADFDDSVPGGVETRGLEVQGSILRQGFSDSTNASRNWVLR